MDMDSNAIRFSGNYARVYIWELPVRFFHWVNAASIAILAITGYLIGSPIAFLHAREASAQYVQGTIRFIHFSFAYVLIVNLVFRIYWGFVGNRFAQWKNWLPLKREQWEEMKRVIRVDVLQTDEHGNVSPGHNALASLSYTILAGIILLSMFTGLALYSDMSESWLAYLFAWISPLFGGDAPIRFFHHLLMWVYVIFTIVHVYLTFYHDYIEGRAVVSSMAGGWKFCHIEKVKDMNDSKS